MPWHHFKQHVLTFTKVKPLVSLFNIKLLAYTYILTQTIYNKKNIFTSFRREVGEISLSILFLLVWGLGCVRGASWRFQNHRTCSTPVSLRINSSSPSCADSIVVGIPLQRLKKNGSIWSTIHTPRLTSALMTPNC